MHIKNIHCVVEKLAECAKCEVEKGIEQLNTEEMGEVADMIKDLCEAEYYARIAKAMEKSEEEDEAEEKYIRKMLKEENKDEYKRYMDEYGEDGERRFYDNYRYADGRFAPKGRGSYRPRSSGRRGRRGYEEPMYFLPPEVYMNYSPEELRDMDRDMGRMYYGGGSSGGNSGGSSGQSGSSGGSGGNSGGSSGGGSSRGYSEGYSDGQSRGYEEGNRRGYSEGYEQGSRDGESRGRSQGSNSRYDRARRGYEETKEMHKGNTAQDNSENMKGLEELLNVIDGDVKEMLPKMSPSEKTMLKQKFTTWAQKV